MGRSELLNALILQTYDVGEADRFCILFTKEQGKIAARARGVRKLTSRMGGSLMKGKKVLVSVHNGAAGYLITGVKGVDSSEHEDFSIMSFLEAEQGIELLLALLHDEEPLPEIYEGTLRFLERCRLGAKDQLLPFTIFVLHFLGSLPSGSHEAFLWSSEEGKVFLEQSRKGAWHKLPPLPDKERKEFSRICTGILADQINRPLKAGVIAERMMR